MEVHAGRGEAADRERRGRHGESVVVEDVRITDVSVTDDGLYRIALITDNTAHTIELDRDNALKVARELWIASQEET